MAFTRTCPTCGIPFEPERSPNGGCPRCLLGVALDTKILVTEGAEATPGRGLPGPGAGRPGAGDQPGASAPSPAAGAREPMPTPEELAELFPFLEIQEPLGRGAMGMVYRARQRDLDRVVALKLLPRELASDPTLAERFRREARSLARLDHPHVVRAHDSGELAEYTYFLMEYVDGVDLRQRLRKSPPSARESLRIVREVAEALEYAHQQGIVHRDIKPENILIDRHGKVKVADFGLARWTLPGQPLVSLTGTHQALGTPHYMSPEQWESPGKVDRRSDLYSLGVVAYELLTGALPMGRFEPPSRRGGCDRRLDRVVMACLERDPARRPQNAAEVVRELRRIEQGRQASGLGNEVDDAIETLRKELGSLGGWFHDHWEQDWKDPVQDALHKGRVKVIDVGAWFRGLLNGQRRPAESLGPRRVPAFLRWNPVALLSLLMIASFGVFGSTFLGEKSLSGESLMAICVVYGLLLGGLALVHLPLLPYWLGFLRVEPQTCDFTQRWKRASSTIGLLGLLWAPVGALLTLEQDWLGHLHLGVAIGCMVGSMLSVLSWRWIDAVAQREQEGERRLLFPGLRRLDVIGGLLFALAMMLWGAGLVVMDSVRDAQPGFSAGLFWAGAPLLGTWTSYAMLRLAGAGCTRWLGLPAPTDDPTAATDEAERPLPDG